MRIVFVILIVLVSVHIGSAQQSSRLALQYFQTGEFEKASEIFAQLYKKEPGNSFYFDKYIECLIELEEYKTCEKLISDRIKRESDNIALYVKQGQVLESQYEVEAADKVYREAIKRLEPNRMKIIQLANEFVNMSKFELAIETYEKGGRMLKDDNIFSYNLGNLYRQQGDRQQMIFYFLNALENEMSRTENVKLLLERYLEGDDWDILKQQLYDRIQDSPDNILYTELLEWYFIQQKDYANALRQTRAIDRRLRENGERVFQLAYIASNAEDYDVAIDAFEYIINQKGPRNPYYLESQKEALKTRQKKITEGYRYTVEQLKELEKMYEDFLEENGNNKLTAKIIYDLAQLEALYLNNLDKSIDLLKELISFPGLNPHLLAESKLSLADFFLIKGERWESTLLYSQVDKAFKDDVLGQIARFRNAKLSYFMGDFSWAQTQFDVLKSSTSKLIANDALDLSVFIMDNLGLDTSVVPMQNYANAELMIFQNKFSEAEELLTQMENRYKDHSLIDDILYAKAEMYVKKREFLKASELYSTIVEEYGDEIRADNSLFKLASILEKQLGEKEKAKDLYERLFLDYSGSTFAVEARKRFRFLRGDFEEDTPEPQSN